MKRIFSLLTAALLLLGLVGCANRPVETESTSQKAGEQTEQATGPEAGENTDSETEQKEDNMNPIATITMQDGGVMKVELYPDVAPNTVKNFISLSNSGFYDGTVFHRIMSGFMIQGGDPDGNGTGGPGYSIKGEFGANGFENELSHTRGVISMARSSQSYDSAGSQFFIMHADYTGLDYQYAAFGKLVEGYVTLDQLAATEVTYNMWGEASVPVHEVVIETIRVDTFGIDYGEPEIIQ